MKPSKSSLSQSHLLRQVRELVRVQQSTHANLVELQRTVAGLVPHAVLDRLYCEGAIDGEEYLTLSLAAGMSEEQATRNLSAAHAKAGQEHWPHPMRETMEPDLPEYAAPKRSAKRPPKKGPELRGHPLD